MKFHSLISIATFTFVSLLSCSRDNLTIDNQLPAGNIIVEKISNDTIYVHQDLGDSQEDWFYWAFRVKGAEGKRLTFVFTKSAVIAQRGPVVSLDKGQTYGYLAEGNSSPFHFTYEFPNDAAEVWFYECHPYTPQMWYSFINGPHSGKYETGVLCKSVKGRDVPYFKITPENGTHALSVAVTCRHHSSEAPASFITEGIVSAFIEDSPLGEWLRENIELNVLPFMDMDGTIDGEQGKTRIPHNHNRDYTEFIFPETKAFAELMLKVQPDIYIDLHNPTHADQHIYSPLAPNPGPMEKIFAELLEKHQEGGLNYKASDDLPFGVDWNTNNNYSSGLSARYWALLNIPGIKVARTIETPFVYANSAEVTPEKLRLFGHGIARTFKAMVEE
jgi:hypothetical protein